MVVLRPLETQFESLVKGCQEKTTIWAIELMALGIDQEDVAPIHALGARKYLR
jgi:hypothetical protein